MVGWKPKIPRACSNHGGWYDISPSCHHVNGVMNTQTNKILAREISFPVQGRNTFQGKGRTLIKKKFPENTGEFSVTFLNVFVKSSKLLWVFILPSWSSHKLRDSSIFDGAFTQVYLQEVNSRRSVTKKNSLDNCMHWITQNPTAKILKNLLKFERTKKSSLKDQEETSIYCSTKEALCLQARKICIVIYSDTEQRK